MEELAPAGAAVTEDDWSAARSRNRRTAYLSCVVGVIVGPLIGVLAVYLTALFATGGARYPVMGLWMAALVAPMAIILSMRSVKEQERSDGVIATLAGQFEAQARGQKFESRLANALDMAEGEPEVVQVIERSFSAIVPDAPDRAPAGRQQPRAPAAHGRRVADGVTAGLRRRLARSLPGGAPGPGAAVLGQRGARRLPQAPGTTQGAMSAMCVPVSIMGRSVGVIHVTGQQHDRSRRHGNRTSQPWPSSRAPGSACCGSWRRRSSRRRRTASPVS